jgi:hypothetical protein
MAPHIGHVSNFCLLIRRRPNRLKALSFNALSCTYLAVSSVGTQIGHVSNSAQRCILPWYLCGQCADSAGAALRSLGATPVLSGVGKEPLWPHRSLP